MQRAQTGKKMKTYKQCKKNASNAEITKNAKMQKCKER